MWHEGLGRRAARQALWISCSGLAFPMQGADWMLSSPAFRWSETTRRHRHCLGLSSATAYRRRADDCPGRDGAGADPRLLAELVAEMGMGLILISHDLGVIAETADDTLVMQGCPSRWAAAKSSFRSQCILTPAAFLKRCRVAKVRSRARARGCRPFLVWCQSRGGARRVAALPGAVHTKSRLAMPPYQNGLASAKASPHDVYD